MTLEELKQEALEACRNRGHKMTEWRDWDRSVFCTCSLCEMYAQIIPEPRPNEVEIGGTAVAMVCTGWTCEWPTTPGYYWFYGWRFGPVLDQDREPELCFVNVRQTKTLWPT